MCHTVSIFSHLSLFPSSPGVGFGQWFIFAAPTMIACLVIAWTYLSVLFCDDWLVAFLDIVYGGYSGGYNYTRTACSVVREGSSEKQTDLIKLLVMSSGSSIRHLGRGG